jgi:predicted nucleic acid-binding protein
MARNSLRFRSGGHKGLILNGRARRFELRTSCDYEILDVAAQLKSEGGHSIAGCWIAATAIVNNATRVHRDPEFREFKKIPQRFLK